MTFELATMTIRTFTRHCRSELADVFGEGDCASSFPADPAVEIREIEVEAEIIEVVDVVILDPVDDAPAEPAEESRALDLDFSRPDYLGLRAHPFVAAASIDAMRALSAGSTSAARAKSRSESERLRGELESELRALLGFEHVILAENGWAAGFGAVAGVVRAHDHVLIDARSRACLREGALAATKNVSSSPRLDASSAAAALREIRARDPKAGVLVITAGLFAGDSELGELDELREVCADHDALLLVDVTHDLGALGPEGRGQLGVEALTGSVDIVTGSFSKCFGATGGFVATRDRNIADALRYHAAQSFRADAIAPAPAAAILESLRISRADEGDALRARLEESSVALRDALEARGACCAGHATAIVTVAVGSDAVARLAAFDLSSHGCHVELAPAAVRLFVSAAHANEDVIAAAKLVAAAIAAAESKLRESSVLRLAAA